MSEIELKPSDPTIFTKCLICCKSKLGHPPPPYYSLAYTKSEWAKKPKCENCGTDMQFLYEVR